MTKYNGLAEVEVPADLAEYIENNVENEPKLERLDRRMAMTVLANFIMLGTDSVGSYALSRHQGDFFSLACQSWLDSFAGVELLNPGGLHLRCMNCGSAWSPNVGINGRLPRGYWKCPNGCNEGAD